MWNMKTLQERWHFCILGCRIRSRTLRQISQSAAETIKIARGSEAREITFAKQAEGGLLKGS